MRTSTTVPLVISIICASMSASAQVPEQRPIERPPLVVFENNFGDRTWLIERPDGTIGLHENIALGQSWSGTVNTWGLGLELLLSLLSPGPSIPLAYEYRAPVASTATGAQEDSFGNWYVLRQEVALIGVNESGTATIQLLAGVLHTAR